MRAHTFWLVYFDLNTISLSVYNIFFFFSIKTRAVSVYDNRDQLEDTLAIHSAENTGLTFNFGISRESLWLVGQIVWKILNVSELERYYLKKKQTSLWQLF